MAWSASLVVAAWLLVIGAAAVLVVGIALGRTADSSLRARAQAVTATVQISARGITMLEGSNDTALDTDTWVFSGAGDLIEGPAGDAGPPSRVAALAAQAIAADAERIETIDADDPTRLLALPVAGTDGQPSAAVVTAASLLPYQQLRDLTVVAVGVVGVLVVIGVHLVLRASLTRALAPVAAMSAQVERWSTTDPTQRLGAHDRPVELESLAATLDALLDRIAAALRHEQRLTAEISHELRTPLAGVRAELDWIRAAGRTDAQRSESFTEVDHALRRMDDVVDGLLASARSATTTPGRCSVADVVDRVLAARRAAENPAGAEVGAEQLSMSADVDPALTVGVEAAVLERVLAPLVDNAARYARSRLLIRADREESLVRIAVVDDGPGVPAGIVDRVLEAGFRGDPHEAHRGAGLGLALSARLVRIAGGDLVVEPAGTTGGGVFAVVLPPG